MSQAGALVIVNPILGLLLACQAVTGLFHDALPPELFEVVHVGGGITLIAVAAAHVILNRGWIKARYFARAKNDA
jgi:hypothetical protein